MSWGLGGSDSMCVLGVEGFEKKCASPPRIISGTALSQIVIKPKMNMFLILCPSVMHFDGKERSMGPVVRRSNDKASHLPSWVWALKVYNLTSCQENTRRPCLVYAKLHIAPPTPPISLLCQKVELKSGVCNLSKMWMDLNYCVHEISCIFAMQCD